MEIPFVVKKSRKNIQALLLFLSSILILVFLSVSQAFAAGATISLSPNSGSYGKLFSVDVVVDGNGQSFNAAQATVTVSPNLSLQSLTTGNCNFSFLLTPSTVNPSFAGVTLGKSTQKCTVYTMVLAPTAKGKGTITLAKGSVRRFGDAVNIFAGFHSGTYTLTNVVKVSPQPTVAPSQGNLYSALLTFHTSENKPVQQRTVTLKSVATPQPHEAKTDGQGQVQFTNLQPGVYNALVTGYPGDHIINVNGSTHTLVLGITVESQQSSFTQALINPFILIGLLILGVFLGGGAIGIFLWWKMKRK